MSQTDNRYQAGRWLLTAEEDLSAVETLFAAEKYAQACFLSQQAGEKAVKALWYLMDADPWGHSIKKLLTEFPNKSELPDFNDWLEKAALLDKYYISTRYPNGLPDLTPGQIYMKDDAQRGMDAARWLVKACRKRLENR
jgi:HEPN domain-containing protein